ncbi:MAG: PEP-CTERM sorting domain-containing protein [Microcystis flos-aquae TF09]|uniref:PEP-CTERM sorting domain-containing protein n=1 Tax=Microcystis flos-aquae TF09 TaxID=2060473 RepID=A0A3E0KYE8_9CHRO|nr:MAG: PEP-CTERM sorting domain-containing protein [Microcystis flos-aquae TF09]
MKIKQLGILSVGVALATLGTGAAQAALVVVPPGLNPGDQYRLVFVTDGTRNATSTNINDYNNFVTSQVTGSALATQLTTAGFNLGTITWKAIGSTSATSAKVNTGTDGSQPDVPIYLIDGNKVANNNADLWDGSIAKSIDRTQIDTSKNASVWTGTQAGGSTGSPLGNAIGFPPTANMGATNQTNSDWINAVNFVGVGQSAYLYGMSSVLTVPSAAVSVPEPSSLLGFITLGGLMLGGAVRKARK